MQAKELTPSNSRSEVHGMASGKTLTALHQRPEALESLGFPVRIKPSGVTQAMSMRPTVDALVALLLPLDLTSH